MRRSSNINNLIALDTNVFIYYLQKHPKFGPVVHEYFHSILAKRGEFITSNITLIEVLAFSSTDFSADYLKRKLLDIDSLKIVPLSNEIAIEAAKIRREYQFSLPDAVQLATAVLNQAQVFITNDKNLKRFKKLKVQLISEIK